MGSNVGGGLMALAVVVAAAGFCWTASARARTTAWTVAGYKANADHFAALGK